MITIDDQMKLTKEMGAIIGEFVLKVVIRKFLEEGCVVISNYGASFKLTPLFESLLGNYDPAIGFSSADLHLDLKGFVGDYLSKLSENHRYALRMYVMSEKDEELYERYESETPEGEEDDISWGRYKAELLYTKTLLDEMVFDKLENVFSGFVDECSEGVLADEECDSQERISDFKEHLDSYVLFLRR